MNPVLPTKLSELIALSLFDLEQVEKNDKYTVNMSYWYWPHAHTCFVCLGGSVLVNRFNFTEESLHGSMMLASVIDLHIAESDTNALYALNYIRQGQLALALSQLGFDMPESTDEHKLWPHMSITPHHENAQRFKTDLAKLATKLAIYGL